MLRARLEAAARELMTPDGWHVDFAAPPGEPALVPPDSVSWRVFKNPVTLFIGGVAAVILELAEPRVRAGVWNHTNFRTDPVTRLRRTGLAAMVTVYGARSVAEAMIAGINRRHARIEGVTPEGERYHAADPELLSWVQATAAFGFLEAYAVYVRPVSAGCRDAYYAEGREAARLYGAHGAPASQAELDATFAAMRERLQPSDVLAEFLAIMQTASIVPRVLRPVQLLFIRAAIDIVPNDIAARLGLGHGLRRWEIPMVRTAATLADRLQLASSPAALACRRLGLPEDYLLSGVRPGKA